MIREYEYLPTPRTPHVTILTITDTFAGCASKKNILFLFQVKARHLTRFPLDPETVVAAGETTVGLGAHRAHPEPLLDAKVASKYDELRNLETLDISLDNYFIGLH